MSGRSAKASRRAVQHGYRSEQERRELWRRRGLRLIGPLSVVTVVAILAGVYFGRSGSSAPRATNQGGSGYPYAVGTPAPGVPAPEIKLPATTGGTFDLAAYKGKAPVLLYFQEGLTCQPCWDQIAAIQKDRAKFRALGITTIVSITTDRLDLIRQKAKDEGLTIPILSDSTNRVSDAYDARTYSMTWMTPHRDGHTFVLVGKDGRILWRADYGGPPKYTMFLPTGALLTDLENGLHPGSA